MFDLVIRGVVRLTATSARLPGIPEPSVFDGHVGNGSTNIPTDKHERPLRADPVAEG
jgi:hypothetical protein